MGLSVNFRQLSVHPRDHASFSYVSQLSVRSWYLPSRLVNSPCICGTLCQLSSTFCASMGPPKTICAAARPSVNFSQLSVWPWDLLSTFRASTRPSVNFLHVRGIFHQLSVQPRDLPSTFFCDRGTFRQPQSTFHASVGPSVNFPCGCGIFVNIPCGWRTIRQLFLRPQHSPSTSVNFLCICRTSCQFYMRLWDCP